MALRAEGTLEGRKEESSKDPCPPSLPWPVILGSSADDDLRRNGIVVYSAEEHCDHETIKPKRGFDSLKRADSNLP